MNLGEILDFIWSYIAWYCINEPWVVFNEEADTEVNEWRKCSFNLAFPQAHYDFHPEM